MGDISVESATLEWLEALAVGDDELTARFGIPVVPEWLAFPEALPNMVEDARANGPDPWGSHLFFDTDGALVGFGGYRGAPVDGAVEIGYAVAPSRRGRGIATAVTRTMIERARSAGVTLVVAHTLPESNPSTSVLERCGFVRTATDASDEDGDVEGDVWRWELVVP
jgi:RimJ/RimL family protein N-acetyltransferase